MRRKNLTPAMLLVEIGGTHTRCAIDEDGVPRHVSRFRNAGYRDLESVINQYLADLTVEAPRRAALAVAAPVDQHPVSLTNLGWTVDTCRLENRFGWEAVTVINDFEALACAVPVLEPHELLAVHAGSPVPDAPIAVLGPGTGLGMSGLVPCGGRWFPLRGEGGHVTLPAANDREAEILQQLRRRHGHVSAERVLSGSGLLSLYNVLVDDPKAASPDEVTRLAESGDRGAGETLDQFFRFLGTVCADSALTLGARGGVYLGGGILPVMRERLLASGFEARYLDKGRFSTYLAPIPVYLIVAETPALRGISRHPRVRAVSHRR